MRSSFGKAAFCPVFVAAALLCARPAQAGEGVPRGARVAIELGGGLGGAALGAGVGYVLWATAVSVSEQDASLFWKACSGWDGLECLFTLPPAALVGLGTGVYFSGRWSGGSGGYWPTLAGTAIGTLSGAATWAMLGQRIDSSQFLLIAAMPFAGAILGYELSATDDAEAATQASSALVLPRLGLRPAPQQLSWAVHF